MPNPLRKNYDQVISAVEETELIPDHVNDWHYCAKGARFRELELAIPEEKRPLFNMVAAKTAPTSVRWRQRDTDWEGGRKGDYLFENMGGGRMTVPFQIFKRLF